MPGKVFFSREEQSTFSDGGEKWPRPRQRLRKSSSEGGSLNARARQMAYQAPSPAVPKFPVGPRMGGKGVDGGMF